jgi:chromosome segregation ATPase
VITGASAPEHDICKKAREQMNKEMSIEEAKKQLGYLKMHCEEYSEKIGSEEADNDEFRKDVQAIEIVLQELVEKDKKIKEILTINASQSRDYWKIRDGMQEEIDKLRDEIVDKDKKMEDLITKLKEIIKEADEVLEDKEFDYIQEIIDEQYYMKNIAQEILKMVEGEKG